MIEGVTVRGDRGDIVWAYHQAIRLGRWTITRAVARPPVTVAKGRNPKAAVKDWVLTAIVEHADGFKARQRPLLFTAPKRHGGPLWCWEVRELQLGERRLTATLGPPLY